MTSDIPKSLGKTVSIDASNRPIKVAYLVPTDESDDNHYIIDAIFYESYTRWAGSYTLLAPCSSSDFEQPGYLAWLKHFDPDFIYTYVELQDEFVALIARECCPIAFLKHDIRQEETDEHTMRSYFPDFRTYFTAISSHTLVHTPRALFSYGARRSSENELMIITAHQANSEHRNISDNFGTAFHVHNVLHELPGVYNTLCLTPEC